MIDTHAHLDFPEFQKDREEVILRAFDSGVKNIINIGVDLERSRKSIALAEKYDGVSASVGLHPDFFMEHGAWNMEQIFGELKNLAKSEKVVAIGETGLDYHHATRNMEHGTRGLEKIKKNQKARFLAQIEIARELNLPVIIHCRDAWNDLYKILNTKYQLPDTKFVLHCYSGSKNDTGKFLGLPNVWFSFSANITYQKPVERAERLAEAVRMVPLDKIMLDSDAPFLAPQEFRGKRNEPAYVKYIAEKIAEIKQISWERVKQETDFNASKFFGILVY